MKENAMEPVQQERVLCGGFWRSLHYLSNKPAGARHTDWKLGFLVGGE